MVETDRKLSRESRNRTFGFYPFYYCDWADARSKVVSRHHNLRVLMIRFGSNSEEGGH